MLMLKKHCGDVTIWTYPPASYVTISYHFMVQPSPPPPVTSFLDDLYAAEANSGIIVVRWYGNNSVQLISNYLTNEAGENVRRWNKKNTFLKK